MAVAEPPAAEVPGRMQAVQYDAYSGGAAGLKCAISAILALLGLRDPGCELQPGSAILAWDSKQSPSHQPAISTRHNLAFVYCNEVGTVV
jgi:hypothetical protein